MSLKRFYKRRERRERRERERKNKETRIRKFQEERERELLETQAKYKSVSKYGIPVLILVILCAGVFVRILPMLSQAQLFAEYGRYFFLDYDSWFHYHFSKQIIDFGYRLNPDPQTWAPQGRVVAQVPLFHYLMAWISTLTHVDLYQTYLWYPIFIGALGIIAWFLLGRKLYGNLGGLLGASAYAIMPTIVQITSFGVSISSASAEVFLALGYLAFLTAKDSNRRIWLPVAGLIFGVTSLVWEGALYFHIPVLVVYWLACAIFKKADRRLHILTLVTIALVGLIALPWYIPTITKYGFGHVNTPASMQAQLAWYTSTKDVLPTLLTCEPTFFIVAVIGYIFLAFKFLSERNTRDILALILMTVGLVAAIGIGARFLNVYLIYGVLLVFTAFSCRLIRRAREQEAKATIGILLAILLIIGFGISVHAAYNYPPMYKAEAELTRIIPTLPNSSVVVSWWWEGSYLTVLGARNVWDIYAESLPAWGKNRGALVSHIYLAQGEAEALDACRQLNASYVFLDAYYYADPKKAVLPQMLNELGSTLDASLFFKITKTGNVVHVEALDRGSNTLLWHLVQNQCEHFKLVWKDDSGLMLFKVV